MQNLAPKLVERLETRGRNAEKGSVVDEFFTMCAKEDEMTRGVTEPGYYVGLADVTKQQLLPLYEEFQSEKNKIEERQRKRQPWKYVVGTIAALEFIELLFFRRGTLQPQILIPSLALEAAVGTGIYYLYKMKDQHDLRCAENRFLNGIAALDDKIETDAKYKSWKEHK